jgi:hypothetical protein
VRSFVFPHFLCGPNCQRWADPLSGLSSWPGLGRSACFLVS